MLKSFKFCGFKQVKKKCSENLPARSSFLFFKRATRNVPGSGSVFTVILQRIVMKVKNDYHIIACLLLIQK